MRGCVLELETYKWVCRACGRSFWQRFPGIQPRLRATEPFRRSVGQKHFDGISRSRLAERERVSSATIERWFEWYLKLLAGERSSRACPQILGIDEHLFTRRHGYATTFCDLKNHKVHDLVLGRSEASLEGYLARLEEKHRVQVVCIDLAGTGEKALPAGAHRGGPFSCDSRRESALPGLLAGDGPDRIKEPRLALAPAPSSAKPDARTARPLGRLSAGQTGTRGDL